MRVRYLLTPGLYKTRSMREEYHSKFLSCGKCEDIRGWMPDLGIPDIFFGLVG